MDRPPIDANWVCETGDEWNGTHIAFRLEGRASSRTLVRFTHGGWRSETDYFTSCNTTWGELMYRLKSAAEGKSRGPLFLAGDLAYKLAPITTVRLSLPPAGGVTGKR